MNLQDIELGLAERLYDLSVGYNPQGNPYESTYIEWTLDCADVCRDDWLDAFAELVYHTGTNHYLTMCHYHCSIIDDDKLYVITKWS